MPKNEKILKGFLQSVLKKTVVKIEIKSFDNTLLEGLNRDDKYGIVDVLVTLVDGVRVHIEMQLHFHRHLLERITFYQARIFSGALNVGEDYDNLKKVISILMIDGKLPNTGPHYHHTFHLYDSVNNVKLTDLLEIHTLPLC
jgi:predicted transposase/invertase (TIGR01784 family)